MEPITRLAEKYNLVVIEDAAHSFPAQYKGRNIGTLSQLTVFSFYATKTIVSEDLYEREISLPIYPKMTEADVSRVIAAVQELIQKYRK